MEKAHDNEVNESNESNETMEKKESPVFILIDTSYWIFYRYFAIMQWWKYTNPDVELFEDPYETPEFVEKFTKTFLDSINVFKKKHKLHKQRSKPETPTQVIACRDCPRCDIWRNKYYTNYKANRTKDDSFMGGPFFKHVYKENNKLLFEAGVDKVLQFPNLEGDDIIAITKIIIRSRHPDATIYIIANDHDYLQILDDDTHIINFQYKNLAESKKVFPEAEKNLFYKIVLGDKSDNIMPVFKKCGPKTCEKYYNDRELFGQALLKEPGSSEKYLLNKTLVSFTEIPKDLINGFLQDNREFILGL
jgi:5'-3' exonuclease